MPKAKGPRWQATFRRNPQRPSDILSNRSRRSLFGFKAAMWMALPMHFRFLGSRIEKKPLRQKDLKRGRLCTGCPLWSFLLGYFFWIWLFLRSAKALLRRFFEAKKHVEQHIQLAGLVWRLATENSLKTTLRAWNQQEAPSSMTQIVPKARTNAQS